MLGINFSGNLINLRQNIEGVVLEVLNVGKILVSVLMK